MIRRLNSLRNQHSSLDSLIQREQLHRYPDTQHIRILKKFKLRLRDEIHQIEQSLSHQKIAG